MQVLSKTFVAVLCFSYLGLALARIERIRDRVNKEKGALVVVGEETGEYLDIPAPIVVVDNVRKGKVVLDYDPIEIMLLIILAGACVLSLRNQEIVSFIPFPTSPVVQFFLILTSIAVLYAVFTMFVLPDPIAFIGGILPLGLAVFFSFTVLFQNSVTNPQELINRLSFAGTMIVIALGLSFSLQVQIKATSSVILSFAILLALAPSSNWYSVLGVFTLFVASVVARKAF